MHSENNICKKIELINFGWESNTSNDSLNLIIDEERNITHEENFSTSSQSLIDNVVDTSFKNNQFNTRQDTVSTNAFNFMQPSTSTNIYQNHSYNSNESVYSTLNNQNFQQSCV